MGSYMAHVTKKASLYLEGLMGPGEAEEFERHVAGCARCGEYLDAASVAYGCASRLGGVHVPEGFAEGVAAAIGAQVGRASGGARHAGRVGPTWRLTRMPARWPAALASLAACAVIAVVGAFVWASVSDRDAPQGQGGAHAGTVADAGAADGAGSDQALAAAPGDLADGGGEAPGGLAGYGPNDFYGGPAFEVSVAAGESGLGLSAEAADGPTKDGAADADEGLRALGEPRAYGVSTVRVRAAGLAAADGYSGLMLALAAYGYPAVMADGLDGWEGVLAFLPEGGPGEWAEALGAALGWGLELGADGDGGPWLLVTPHVEVGEGMGLYNIIIAER